MVRPQIWPPCDVHQACAHDAACTGHGKGSYLAYLCHWLTTDVAPSHRIRWSFNPIEHDQETHFKHLPMLHYGRDPGLGIGRSFAINTPVRSV